MSITIKQLTLQQIEKVIKDNDPDQFVGVIENSYFEFREREYLIEDKSGVDWIKYKARIELLKDFSSMSNSGGGYIVLGLKPERTENRQGEYVEKISGVKKELIDIERWLDLLSDGLIPRFPRGSVEYGYIGEKDQVFWIHIQNAKSLGCYPFIILQDQWNPEEGVVLKGQVYGIYTHDGAKNIQLINPYKFQEYLSGALSGKVSTTDIEPQVNRLSSLIDRLEQNKGKSVIEVPTKDQKKRIIEQFVNKLDPDSDIFYLIASPTRGSELKEFWDKSDYSLYHYLKNPPILRQTGWDLSVWITEYPQPGGDSWEIMNGNRKILNVSKNGLIAAGVNVQEFLDWGLREDSKTTAKKLLNAFALVEYINSFFLLIKQLIESNIIAKDTSFQIEIGFIMKNGEKYSLVFTVGNFLPRNYGPQKKELWQYGPYKTEDLVNSSKISGSIVQDIFASGFGYVPDFTQESYLQKTEEGVVVNEELYRKQK